MNNYNTELQLCKKKKLKAFKMQSRKTGWSEDGDRSPWEGQF